MSSILIYGANSSVARAFIKNFPQHDYTLFSRHKIEIKNRQYKQTVIQYDNPSFENVNWKQIDAILYCVGITNGRSQELNRVNCDYLDIFLKHIPLNKPFHFVSSIAVVSNDSPYAQSKIYAEQLLQDKMRPVTIYRPSVLVGDEEKNNFPLIHKFISVSPIIPLLTPSPAIYPVKLDHFVQIIDKEMLSPIPRKTINLSGQKKIFINEQMNLFIKKNRTFYIKLKISVSFIQRIAKILSTIPFFPRRLFLIQQILSYHPHESIACEEQDYYLLNQDIEIFR